MSFSTSPEPAFARRPGIALWSNCRPSQEQKLADALSTRPFRECAPCRVRSGSMFRDSVRWLLDGDTLHPAPWRSQREAFKRLSLIPPPSQGYTSYRPRHAQRPDPYRRSLIDWLWTWRPMGAVSQLDCRARARDARIRPLAFRVYFAALGWGNRAGTLSSPRGA